MTWVVLLRGINVGGHRKVPMGELRDALTDAGFAEVRTYIQSGNVLVAGDSAADPTRQFERVLADRFGLDDVPVLAMSADRVRHAREFSADTFAAGAEDGDHAKRTHVVFFQSPPPPVRRASLDPDEFAPDRFVLDVHAGAAELHISYDVGAGSSRLTLDRIERAYGVRGTARNLSTVEKLLTLAADA